MKLMSALCFLMVAAEAFAGEMETVMAPPGVAMSGQLSEFTVYVHNSGEASLSVQLPDLATCVIECTGRTEKVSAAAVGPLKKTAIHVSKGQYLKLRYAFTVPHGMEGPARMNIPELNIAGVMFLITTPVSEKTPLNTTIKDKIAQKPVPLDSLFTLYQPYLVNFSAYQPMYFLVGTNPSKSKFQISFKYQVLNPTGGLVAEFPWLQGVNLGYTQTSFWDLKSESAPFDSTSYKPELFFISPNLELRPSWMRGLFVQSGFQHESNGRGGPDSRSTNYFYVKPVFIFFDPSTRNGLEVAPRFWTYLGNDDDTNPDLADYRGYFDLGLKMGKEDGFVLGSNFRWAEKGASVQLDTTYPISQLLFQNAGFYLHIHYVNALAENMLDYQKRTEAVRIGFCIVR
jgi:outer membrane phospholipase A